MRAVIDSIRSGLTPDPVVLRRFALTLPVAIAGGYAAYRLNLPLAWMLGAMLVVAAGSLLGAPFAVPQSLRAVMLPVLGVMLGSSFTPDIVDRLGYWWVTALGVVAYIAVGGGLSLWFCLRFTRLDLPTAYFSVMPGGFNEMATVGPQMGGESRTIILMHASRILMVATGVPLSLQLLGILPTDYAANAAAAQHAPVDLADAGLLLACAILGPLLGKACRLPASNLIGPIIASGLVHGFGLSTTAPPTFLIFAAQVVVGAALGARFAGGVLKDMLRVIGVAAALTLLLMAVTLAFVLLLPLLVPIKPATILVGFAPGGFPEMSLIAFALGLDPAFVAAHHALRVVVVVILVPLAYRAWHARRKIGYTPAAGSQPADPGGAAPSSPAPATAEQDDRKP